jgi:hypothetical protein
MQIERARDAMNRYVVRVQNPRALGFITQADHYADFDFESSESLEEIAGRLAAKGFQEEKGGRWIMPGAILWIKKQ